MANPKRCYCVKTDEARNESRPCTLDHLPTGGITNFRRKKTKSVNRGFWPFTDGALNFQAWAGYLFEPEMKLGPSF